MYEMWLTFTAIITSISVWGLVESQVGIIAACLMTLRPLIRDFADSRIFNRIMNSTRTLIGPLSQQSRTAGSKTGLSKISSEQGSNRLRDIDGFSQNEDGAFAQRSYTSIPVPLGNIHVQKDVDVVMP